MKKYAIMMVAVLCMSLALSACVGQKPEETELSQTSQPTAGTTGSTTISTTEQTKATVPPVETTAPQETKPMPVYERPIALEPQNNDDYNFERKYRICYYRIWGEFTALLNEEQRADEADWLEAEFARTNYGRDQNTMLLADWVRRYNIPREAFDRAVEEFMQHNKIDTYSVIPEEIEPPNADIIYTFDDEIINEYYRYE